MMMMPVPVNYLAVLLCAVLAMIVGYVWFGPLFGKLWLKLEGMPEDAMERAKSDPKMKAKMYRGYAIQFIAALVMAFVLAHSIIFAGTYLQISGVSAGLMAAIWSWLGFVVPPLLGMVLWENRSWKLWSLISGSWLVILLIMGIVLSVWH